MDRKIRGIFTENFEWKNIISQAESEYSFQPALTTKLDNKNGDLTELTLLEIVLWKVNRYPEFDSLLLDDLTRLRKEYQELFAREILLKLLHKKGFDLAMTSTVLRFTSPMNCQIVDQRVLRFIRDAGEGLKIPYNKESKVDFYFEYLKELRSLCALHGIPFEKADRIFYQLDKIVNKDIPIKY